MKRTLAASLLMIIATGCTSAPKEVDMKNFYDIEVKTIGGDAVKMEHYKGQTLLIVNTASKCGFTGQYDGLQKLYDTYKEQGFVVLGFPSNDFLKQEPGSNEDIASFCRINYGVTFPMFSKISVKGAEQHPLYAYLTSAETNPDFAGKISWNFNKFLVSRNGEVINRFGSRVKPSDESLIEALEKALGK